MENVFKICQSVSFLTKYAVETRPDRAEFTEYEVDDNMVGHQGASLVELRRAEIKNGKKPQGQYGGSIRKITECNGTHVNQTELRSSVPTHTERSKWQPPAEGIWKLNTDTSFLSNTRDSAAGFIARTNEGVVVLAGGQRLQACEDPEEAEFAAVAHRLAVLSKYYRGPVFVESDCASIVTLLNNRACNRSARFARVADIWHFENVFKEVSFRDVRRSSYKMAHELVAQARRQGDYLIIGDVPLSLRRILMEDCNSSPNVI